MIRRFFVTLVVLAWLSAAGGAARAQSTTAYDTNLLENGDAEENFGARDTASVVKPNAWETTGTFTVVQYGADPAFPEQSSPGSTRGELNLFEGGTAPASTAKQTVALDSYAADVDAGRVTFALSAKLGGVGAADDHAAVSVTFLDANGAALSVAGIGPVTAAQRLFNTGFVPQEASGAVPKGARRAVVAIVLARAGTTGYNHATADVVSLVLLRP